MSSGALALLAASLLAEPTGVRGQEKDAPPAPAPAAAPAPGPAQAPAGPQAPGSLRPEDNAPFAAAYGAKEIADRLVKVADEKGGAEGAEMRLLAATALDAAGEVAAARKLRQVVLQEGPEPAHRARAAYLLGLHNFLQERYTVADGYWKALPRIDPDSPWTARAARYRPYLDLLRDRVLPAFDAEFVMASGEKVRRSGKDLAGRRTLFCFWTASAWSGPEGTGLVAEANRIAARAGKIPGDITFEILGVNLDASRETFEQAGKGAGMAWPVAHDCLGFGTPLARAFGIPRAPHWILVGPDGKVAYAGARLTGKRSVEEALFAPPQQGKAEKAEKAEPKDG
jgi:hypothetical protein